MSSRQRFARDDSARQSEAATVKLSRNTMGVESVCLLDLIVMYLLTIFLSFAFRSQYYRRHHII